MASDIDAGVLLEQAGLPATGFVETPLTSGGPSGHRVSLLRLAATTLLYKRGPASKVRAEARGCRLWDRHMPGVARHVLAEVGCGDEGSLLGEYIEGESVTELWSRDAAAAARAAGLALARLLAEAWRRTYREGPPVASYARDIEERLELLWIRWPDLGRRLDSPVAGGGGRAGRLVLAELARRESSLVPPFTVLTHGDLTPDNVLYDPLQDHVHLIDMGRAGDGDHMIDVGKLRAAEIRNGWRAGEPLRVAAPWAEPVVRVGLELSREWNDVEAERRLAISCARTLLGSARLMDEARAGAQLDLGLEMVAAAVR